MKPASSAETATRTSAAGPTPRCSTKATRGWTWLHEAAARSTSCWTSAHRMKLVGCASANCGSSRVHSSSRLTFSVSPRPRPALGAPSGSCDSDQRAGPSGPSAAERVAHAAAEGAERRRMLIAAALLLMLIDALWTCGGLPVVCVPTSWSPRLSLPALRLYPPTRITNFEWSHITTPPTQSPPHFAIPWNAPCAPRRLPAPSASTAPHHPGAAIFRGPPPTACTSQQLPRSPRRARAPSAHRPSFLLRAADPTPAR